MANMAMEMRTVARFAPAPDGEPCAQYEVVDGASHKRIVFRPSQSGLIPQEDIPPASFGIVCSGDMSQRAVYTAVAQPYIER